LFWWAWNWLSRSPGTIALALGLVMDAPALVIAGGALLALRLFGPLFIDAWLIYETVH
jgi:hypothetical protein